MCTELSVIKGLSHIHAPELVKVCTDHDLIDRWQKDLETLRSLQLCIGFAQTDKVWHCNDIMMM